MMRSDNIRLMLMGTAAFAATFAGGTAYLNSSQQKSAPQTVAFVTPSRAATSTADAASTTRGGFGKTAQSRSIRVSAGG